MKRMLIIATAVFATMVASAQPRDGYYHPRNVHPPHEHYTPPQQMQPENRLIPKTVDVGSLKNLSDRARSFGGQCELLGNRMAHNMRVFGPGAGITKQSMADAVMMGCL